MDNFQNTHWTDDAELLERYALNRIDPSDRAPLEKHLHECTQCQHNVERELEFLAGIKLAGRERLKGMLHKRLKSEEANVFQRYQIVSLAAAVLVIVVGLGLFRFYIGSFEWPTKFSSRKYIVQQSLPDSNKAQEKKEELQKPEADRLTAHQAQAQHVSPMENPSTTSSAGAGAPSRSETALSNAESFQNEIQPGENTRAFWLLGTVIVTPESNDKIHLSAKTERGPSRQKALKKDFLGQGRTFTVRKDGALQTITLRQRPSSSLPKRQMEKHLDDRAVRTLVEKTPRGLNLTLYRDTLFQASEIQRATIEPVTEDSLIVNLANERIAYRIPGGWSAQPSTKSNFERR